MCLLSAGNTRHEHPLTLYHSTITETPQDRYYYYYYHPHVIDEKPRCHILHFCNIIEINDCLIWNSSENWTLLPPTEISIVLWPQSALVITESTQAPAVVLNKATMYMSCFYTSKGLQVILGNKQKTPLLQLELEEANFMALRGALAPKNVEWEAV